MMCSSAGVPGKRREQYGNQIRKIVKTFARRPPFFRFTHFHLKLNFFHVYSISSGVSDLLQNDIAPEIS